VSDHHIQLGLFVAQVVMIVVQFAAFGGLIWYAIETKRMRKAAEAQVEVSQNLIVTAGDQVEGLSKPCVMLASSPRNPEDAIIGPLGNSVALRMEGMFVVENIGSGPALNVRYEFIAVGETARFFRSRGIRYVQNILDGDRSPMAEAYTAYNGQFEVIFDYESIGGRRYRTKINMDGYVFTGVSFAEVI
jgi:hypothetical protein